MKRLSLLALLTILLLGTVKAQTITGVYDSDFNEMTLQINGNKVTGTYKWNDGRIEGMLSGHTLTGRWTQSNAKGRLVFVFNSDFSAFTGKWSYNDAEPNSKWDGKKKGVAITASSIAGVYDSDFNEMTLQINGNKVIGTYKWNNGRIEGTLSGHTLTGRWTQSNAKGRFVFVFNSDFSGFTGKWSYNDAEPASKWDGKKKK